MVTIDLVGLNHSATQSTAEPKALDLAKQILREPAEVGILDNIENIRHLPSTTDLVRLCYLATITNQTTKALCCQRIESVFHNCQTRTYKTLCGFKLAVIPFAFFSLAGLTSFVNASDLPIEKQNWINAIAYFVGGLGSAMISLYITGVNFYRSERALNEKQEALQLLESQYNEMAYELARIRINHPPLGIALANEIKLSSLRVAANTLGLKSEEIDNLFCSLKAVRRYIKKGISPKQHLLAQYIEFESMKTRNNKV